MRYPPTSTSLYLLATGPALMLGCTTHFFITTAAVLAFAPNNVPHLPARSVVRTPQQLFSESSTTKTMTQSSTKSTAAISGQEQQQHWMDYLKFGGSQPPNFDVIERTKQYTAEPGYKRFVLRDIRAEWYDEANYIFRGPVVGPINRRDLVRTNTLFGLERAFPDLERQTFGFTVDPDNPYRCLFFERWVATHTGDLDLTGSLAPLSTKKTNRKSISPVMPFSINWTPDGKIIYEALTTAVDRFEGNTTKGKVAVFGLLETAGVSLDNNVASPLLILQQKLGRALATDDMPVTHSKPDDIPSWWKSKAVGAEPTDM